MKTLPPTLVEAERAFSSQDCSLPKSDVSLVTDLSVLLYEILSKSGIIVIVFHVPMIICVCVPCSYFAKKILIKAVFFD